MDVPYEIKAGQVGLVRFACSVVLQIGNKRHGFSIQSCTWRRVDWVDTAFPGHVLFRPGPIPRSVSFALPSAWSGAVSGRPGAMAMY